jgi:hypothetical protein
MRHARRDNFESRRFEARDDRADGVLRNCVGFDDGKGALDGHYFFSVMNSRKASGCEEAVTESTLLMLGKVTQNPKKRLSNKALDCSSGAKI